MNFEQWLAHNMNIDFGEDSLDIMKQAYIAGLQTAYNQMYINEDGNYDFVMWEIKKLIEESK